jgi:predicted patatin/cPLA2 family phospholipase
VSGSLHPVAEVLRERAESGSLPGERRDGNRVGLVLEGGGMRGVVSAAMTAALERLGYTNSFDLVLGSSAGAINGAALIAGVAAHGAATYHGALASKSFVNPARVLVGRPVIDVEYVLDYASADLDAGRHERVVESPIELHCVAVDVETARSHSFTGMSSKAELLDALLASSRMPWAGGPPVQIAGRSYLDGALLGAPVPVDEAIAEGATHVLVLQTRPHGELRKSASKAADLMIARYLRKLNPDLLDLYNDRFDSYERCVGDIARRSAEPGAEPPHVLGLRPPAGTAVVSQTERRSEVLAAAAAQAERIVEDALSLGAAAR